VSVKKRKTIVLSNVPSNLTCPINLKTIDKSDKYLSNIKKKMLFNIKLNLYNFLADYMGPFELAYF
jgi:hypothetical protein